MARKKTKTTAKKATAKKTVSKAEQRERTRARLIALARDEFGKRGYTGVGTERLVARAKLTRGALYHQFADKRALFQAALEDAQGDIVAAIGRAVENAADDWSILRDGCHAFLREASRPEIRRIVLIDGPAVLGWSEWRRIDAANGIKELREGLRVMMEKKVIKAAPLDALTFMLSGAMNDGALWIADADDTETALGRAMETMDMLLEGLRA